MLPLPLHHAYPFIVGMLSTLTCGTAIVLPDGATGPLIIKALTYGEATAIIGVPRLYDALMAAIQSRVEEHGVVLRLGWRGLLRLAIAVQRATGLRPGSFLFAPIRRAIAPHLRYLVSGGALVALVRPDSVKLHPRGAMNIRDGTRIVLAETALDLPSYQRLSGFAVTDQPLPRTRLGKYRRFLLHDLYARALAGGPQRTARMLDEADLALLRDPIAGAAWALLRDRFPDRVIDLDVDPNLDLNLDSFAWMELEVALEARTGVRLTEADVAGIETLRDLLRFCVARQRDGAGIEEVSPLARDTERWLAPRGLLLTAAGLVLYGLNWVIMHTCFQLRVSGLEHLPSSGAYVITPNHVSDLDAMAIAAALPLSRARHVYWAGDIVRLFYSRLTQIFCRAVHLFPVDERYPDAGVATAVQVLRSGQVQVWFPEGWRSPDGNLQRFLPGIGQLLLRTGAPAVPAWVEGAFEALPRGRRIPRFHRISLCFGPALNVEQLANEGSGKTEDERIADGLRSRVVALGRTFRAVVEQVA